MPPPVPDATPARPPPVPDEPGEAPLIEADTLAVDDSSPAPTLEEAVQMIPESTRSLLEKRLRGRFIGVTRLSRNALIK